MKKLFVILISSFPFLLMAQDFSLGVRIGLNFNSFISPSEVAADGSDLERAESNTGFLIGATGQLALTDNFGVRAELLYSQKGGKQKYEGPASLIFNPGTPDAVLAKGERFASVRITNNYIDLPLAAYVHLGPKFRLTGGINIGLLIGSFGTGELRFDGVSNMNSTPIEFTSTIDYNYLKDEGFAAIDVAEFEDPFTYFADGKAITVPQTLGAYYLEFAEQTEPYFNRIELGLTGGISYYLNGALYLSFAANYGLTDATVNLYDISYAETDGLDRVLRADKDSQLSLQASLGFQF